MNVRRELGILRLSLASVVLAAAACGGQVPESTGESTGAAVITPNGGVLMPFDGLYGTCLEAMDGTVQVVACGNQSTEFVLDKNSQLHPFSNQSLCLNGDTTTGKLSVTAACNASASQQWLIEGGQIIVRDATSSRRCIDIPNGNTGINVVADLAVCSSAEQQTFWPAGFKTRFDGHYLDPVNNSPECLTLLQDQEVPGGQYVIWDCNGGSAQTYVLDQAKHIALANRPGLCLQGGVPQNNVASVTLQTCHYGVDSTAVRQEWKFMNTGLTVQGGGTGVAYSALANQAFGCLTDQTHPGIGGPVNLTPCQAAAFLLNPQQLWN